jgi:broad specificity phosphatase PhoE
VTVTRLLLLRHAMPVDDARGRCYGRLDVGLSPEGLSQAAELGRRLEADAVVSSPARRALETAAALGEPEIDEKLRELDFGELEGRTYEEIERERPELFARWMRTPTEVRFPGGEGFDDLRVRAVTAASELRERHRGAAVAVVTHGGVVRALLADALGLPSAAIFRLDVGYARVSVVDWFDGDAPVVRLVNGTARDLPGLRLG